MGYAHAFANDDWELTVDMVTRPFSGGWPELIAVLFMVHRAVLSSFGARGCCDNARNYGRRWLWTTFYDDTAGKYVSFGTALNKGPREMLWLMARTHESAWSVIMTCGLWNLFRECWDASTIVLRGDRGDAQRSQSPTLIPIYGATPWGIGSLDIWYSLLG